MRVDFQDREVAPRRFLEKRDEPLRRPGDPVGRADLALVVRDRHDGAHRERVPRAAASPAAERDGDRLKAVAGQQVAA